MELQLLSGLVQSWIFIWCWRFFDDNSSEDEEVTEAAHEDSVPFTIYIQSYCSSFLGVFILYKRWCTAGFCKTACGFINVNLHKNEINLSIQQQQPDN